MADQAKAQQQDLQGACDHLQRLRDLYALAHLVADFLAGLTFTVGSVLFFWPSTETPGVWLFLIGSLLFAAKPTVRLVHSIHDRTTRTRLERALSEEAGLLLRQFDPRSRFLRM